MKLNKILIVSLLLLAIMTIGAVSATDSSDVSTLSQADDGQLSIDNSYSGDLLGDGEGNEPDAGSNEPSITIYSEAYVDDTIVDVRLVNGSEGSIKIEDGANNYFNESLGNLQSEVDGDDDNFVHYFIASSKLVPALSVGKEYDLTVTYTDGDGNDFSNDGSVILFERNQITYSQFNITINIETISVNFDNDDALASIRARDDAQNKIAVVLTNDEDNFRDEFECELDKFDPNNIEDDADSDYNWFIVRPSDFRDVGPGNYNLNFTYFDDAGSIQQYGEVRLTTDGEGFDFNPIIKPIYSIDYEDYWWRAAVRVNSPGDGNFTVIVSKNGADNTLIFEQYGEDVAEWNLDDLQISEMGAYEIFVKYTSPNGDVTDVCEGKLIVSEMIVPEEFDVNNPNSTLVSVYCPVNATGFIAILISYDDGEDWHSFDPIYHEIVESDYEKYINYTISDVGITNNDVGYYFVQVFFVDDVDDELDVDGGYNKLDEFDSDAVDNTKFRAHVAGGTNILSNESVVSVYCPEGSAGIVNVTILDEEGDVVSTSIKNIANKDDENWLNWNVTDLGIDVGFYLAKIVVNEDKTFTEEFDIYGPITIEQSAYVDSDDEERVYITYVQIPTYIKDAVIVINFNGSEKFRKQLSDFVEADDTTTIENLTWSYARRHGHILMEAFEYSVNTKNIGCTLAPGTYNVSVSLIIDEKTFTDESNVTLYKVNSVSENGVTINIYDSEDYYFDDDEMSIAEIVCGDIDGYVVVTVAGDDDWNKTFYLENHQWDRRICPCDLNLNADTYNMAVTVFDKDDNELAKNTATITLDYGDEGIMDCYIREQMQYSDECINIWFAVNDISGDLVIKFNGTEYYNEHIDINDFDPDKYDDEGRGHITFSPYQLGVEIGYYDLVEISYYGDNGINDTDYREDIEVCLDEPEIYLRYSEWESRKSQYTINSDDLIGVHVNSDNISSVRIVVKIGDETYLDAMMEDLNLTPNYDVNNILYGYYNIGLIHLNKTFNLGEHYDDVTAYYYSDNYQLDTSDAARRGDNPDFFDVIGIVDEIDVNDDSDILYVVGDKSKSKVILDIWDYQQNDWLNPIEYNIKKSDDNLFISWKLSDLKLDVGDYRIEAKFDDDTWIFDTDFSVVNKSEFYAKIGCDWFFTTDAVIKVWCPEGGNIIVNLSRWGEHFFEIEHSITDDEKGTYVGFTLANLNITSPEWYDVNITVDGKQITDDDAGLWVPSPVDIPGTNVYLPEGGFNEDESMKIAELYLPSDVSGNVTVVIDGAEYVNKNIESLESRVEGSKVIYKLYTSDLDYPVETGLRNVDVIFDEFSQSKVLNFLERNTKSKDGISIVICNGDTRIDWGDVIVEIIAPNNANGNIVVKLNDSEAAAWDELSWVYSELYDEGYSIYYICTNDLNIPDVGKYNILVTYDDSFSNNDTITFMRDHASNVWMNDNSYEGTVTPNDHWFVISPNGETGRVVLTVNGEVRLNKTIDELDNNDWGDKIITPRNATLDLGYYKDVLLVFYSDEDYSYQAIKSNEVGVVWGYVDIHVPNDEINVWDCIANIHAPKAANGTIVFKIGDVEYFTCALTDITETAPDDEEDYMFYFLTLSDFTDAVKGGNYTNVMIYYYGDDGYNTTNLKSGEPRDNVTIYANSKINMDDFEYVYGTAGNVAVNVTGGTIVKDDVSVDGHSEAQIDIVDGVITIEGLEVGQYVLRVITTPDEYSYSIEDTIDFNVTDAESDVEFSNDIVFDYGTSGTTNITLTGATVDLENISVDGHNEAIISLNDNVITVSNLTVGNYALNVITTPNKNYKSTQKTVAITVNRLDSPISIDIPKVEYTALDEFTIKISNVTDVNVTINNKPYAVRADGTVDVDTATLDADSYEVIVSNAETSIYKANSTSKVFTIVKKQSDVSISVGSNYAIGESFSILITNNTAVNVTINGDAYAVKADGSVDVDTTKLPADEYTVVASIAEDGKFKANSTTAVFTISKLDSPISIDIPKVEYTALDEFTIKISNVTDVNVTINNKPYAVRADGSVDIDTTDLDADTYVVFVSNEETANYKSNYTSKEFVIVKKQGEVAISVGSHYGIGESFSIIISNNTVVNVTINGDSYAVRADGSVDVDTTKLPANEYIVVASIDESGKYKGNSTSAKFTISRMDSPIAIEMDKVEYTALDEFTIKISNVTAVEVTINGKPYGVRADGTVDIDTTALDADTYSIIVSNDETPSYRANSTSKEFTIVKKQGEVAINVGSNYTVGESFSIVITNNTDVYVTINGDVYSVRADGSVDVNTTKLPAGEYTVVASIDESGKFKANSTSAKFTISKLDSPIVIDIPKSEYTALDSFTIKISNVTDVNVTINGKPYAVKADGSVDIDTTALDANTYTVIASNEQTPLYNANSTSKVFTIVKKQSEISISVGPIHNVGENFTIVIANNTAVNVTINGDSYAVRADGTVDVDTTKLKASQYTVVASAAGDGKYLSANKTAKFTVSKLFSKIEFTSVSGKHEIQAKLTDLGGEAIANAAIDYFINGVKNSTTTNENGMVFIKAYNNCEVDIVYAGNDLMLPANATITLKNIAPERIETKIIGDNYTQYAVDFFAGERGGFFKVQLKDVSGAPLANKTVNIGYNGKCLVLTSDSDGFVQVQINLLAANTLTFAVAFLGDDKYDASFEVYKITINKKTTSLTAPAKTYKASAKTKSYTVTLKTIKGSSADGKTYLGSGKTITLSLNGKTYTAKTNDKGQATFKLDINKKGTFTATVNYAGDNTYNAAKATAKIKIS
ncbi:hypothetical protein [uncultured Methanobrevibacter sp.]|uniref:hypothetical protein n=1 Tax=uncultured Methanobrevibacter sp. TaxID=253161 RepID=UPI002624B977|nr:hypothetical protein [uncultured Methanobrevibacter sp.]